MSRRDQDPQHLPPEPAEALKTAMMETDTPPEWYDDLAWIAMQESGGIVGVRDAASTAAGLFQLEHHDLMPNGAASLGNAVDECIGGIRYIKQRYGTASAAKVFWRDHGWY